MTHSAMHKLDESAYAVVAKRGRPLLVLYYAGDAGHIVIADADDAYEELRQVGLIKEDKLPQLDVLLHTLGGDPDGAYRLAQAIRSFTNELDFLVPNHAFSAGSLLSLSGDCIWFGDNANLSPFDIKLTDESSPESEVSLASVDKFLEFATEARNKIEIMLKRVGSKRSTTLESDLLCELVNQVGALKIGEYFRERLLTAEYAQVLLDSYMFRDTANGVDLSRDIIDKMVHSSPSHDFIMDFQISRDLGLNVQQLDTSTSDLVKGVVTHLEDLTDQGLICMNLADDYKMPFIKFYGSSGIPQGENDDYDTSEEAYEEPADEYLGGTPGDVQKETGET